ncbi:MAG: NUDIX hydrolase [Nitrospirales bacterium]|nr:MAG: NUDIX hydrolase [Nitrospirales bacterium]
MRDSCNPRNRGQGKPVRIVDKKVLSEGKFLRFVLASYVDSSGITRNWELFERINCSGIVAIVPVTDDGNVLLIRQFRPPVNGYVIEFPAGLNDKGDTLIEAAHRELREETGYVSEDMTPLVEGPMSSGASGEILTVFLARGLSFKGIGERDETEDIEVLNVPLNELDARLEALRAEGNYIDLKIYGLVELAKRRL